MNMKQLGLEEKEQTQMKLDKKEQTGRKFHTERTLFLLTVKTDTQATSSILPSIT